MIHKPHGRCRLLVTSVFGGGTTGTALAAAADLQVRIRVLNPSGGTFRPKLYLARSLASAVAVVGSANLTSGLVANIETALVVSGKPNEPPVADCWRFGERLCDHSAAVDWSPAQVPVPDEQFDPALLRLLRRAVPVGSVVSTLSQGRPNRVTDITADGVYLETERSQARGAGPQLVPAWMLQLAWDYLQLHDELTNRYLLADDGLNVKRASAVSALLARLPGVHTAYTRPILLQRLR